MADIWYKYWGKHQNSPDHNTLNNKYSLVRIGHALPILCFVRYKRVCE